MKSNDQKTNAFVILAGSVAALVGTLLVWFELSDATSSETLKGIELSPGLGAAALAAVGIIMGVVLFVRGGKTGGKGSSVTTVVLMAFVLIIAAYSSFAPGDSLASLAAEDVGELYGISSELAEQAINDAVDSGALEVGAGIGAYLSAIGSLLALAGGIMGITRSKQIRQSVQAPAASEPMNA